jgi:integrase/recombinase XerD
MGIAVSPSTILRRWIHLVQATLGHASVTTTGRYLHARPQDSSSRFLLL